MGIILSIYIAQIIEIGTLAVGFYTFRNLPKIFKFFLAYICVSTFTNLMMYIIPNFFSSNYVLIHIYTPIEFIMIMFFIFHFIKITYTGLVKWFIIILYLIFWTIAKMTIEPLNMMDNYSSSLASGIIVLFTTYVFLKRALITNSSLIKDPVILIFQGTLIYFGGNLFVMALSNLIFLEDVKTISLLWTIHSILHIVFNLICIYAFLFIDREGWVDNLENINIKNKISVAK